MKKNHGLVKRFLFAMFGELVYESELWHGQLYVETTKEASVKVKVEVSSPNSFI